MSTVAFRQNGCFRFNIRFRRFRRDFLFLRKSRLEPGVAVATVVEQVAVVVVVVVTTLFPTFLVSMTAWHELGDKLFSKM